MKQVKDSASGFYDPETGKALTVPISECHRCAELEKALIEVDGIRQEMEETTTVWAVNLRRYIDALKTPCMVWKKRRWMSES